MSPGFALTLIRRLLQELKTMLSMLLLSIGAWASVVAIFVWVALNGRRPMSALSSLGTRAELRRARPGVSLGVQP
jgi:hypothetical protein